MSRWDQVPYMMRELSLFSGAGGGLLATQHLLGMETIGYVEWDKDCQEMLEARIKDGILSDAPIYGDIRAFIHRRGHSRAYQGLVDVITAGFPCPAFSVAGKRKADLDSRDMWPATRRTIGIVRPEWVFMENVPGLLSVRGANGRRYYGRVLSDLAQLGYDARWGVLSAEDVGADHLRKRLWIVAHAHRPGLRQQPGGRCRPGWSGQAQPVIDGEARIVSHP